VFFFLFVDERRTVDGDGTAADRRGAADYRVCQVRSRIHQLTAGRPDYAAEGRCVILWKKQCWVEFLVVIVVFGYCGMTLP